MLCLRNHKTTITFQLHYGQTDNYGKMCILTFVFAFVERVNIFNGHLFIIIQQV